MSFAPFAPHISIRRNRIFDTGTRGIVYNHGDGRRIVNVAIKTDFRANYDLKQKIDLVKKI